MKTTILKGLTALCLCCLFFLGSFFGSISCPPALAAVPFFKSAQADEPELSTLESWVDGANKQAIIDFVEGPAQNIPVEDRIAVFDNDGTLWTERPEYFQGAYIADRTKRNLKTELQEMPEKGSLEGVIEALPISSSMTVEEYRADVLRFLQTTIQESGGDGDYTSFGVPYINLTYKPMIELVQYLQANDFSVFICSGGGMDFVRAFSEEEYGIPRQNVIGSVTINHYERDTREVIRSSGTPVVELPLAIHSDLEEPEPELEPEPDYTEGGYPTPSDLLKPFIVNPFNDKEGKAIGIERYLGKKPIMAVGNSDGDFFMFDYTDSNNDPRLNSSPLIVLLNHDAECPAEGFGQDHDDCEYTYNSDVDIAIDGEDPRQDFCDDPEYCSLAVAQSKSNWLVVSMEDDFNRIFDWEGS